MLCVITIFTISFLRLQFQNQFFDHHIINKKDEMMMLLDQMQKCNRDLAAMKYASVRVPRSYTKVKRPEPKARAAWNLRENCQELLKKDNIERVMKRLNGCKHVFIKHASATICTATKRKPKSQQPDDDDDDDDDV